VIHEGEVVVGVGVPRPIHLERPGRLAARCVAQVGRDTAVLVLEFLDRVEGRPVRHEADGRVLAPAGDDEQREAGAGLLVVNADLTLVAKRHVVLPFAADYLGPNTSMATRPALTAQGQPA
jgi:hypothetical protein